MTFRNAMLVDLLGGALVIAMLLLAQRAHAECHELAPRYYACDDASSAAIEPPDYLPSGLRQNRVYDNSFERGIGRPYSDDYPGYAPLDPAVHDQLDRIERRLNELQR